MWALSCLPFPWDVRSGPRSICYGEWSATYSAVLAGGASRPHQSLHTTELYSWNASASKWGFDVLWHVVKTYMKTAFESVLSDNKHGMCISMVTRRLQAVNINIYISYYVSSLEIKALWEQVSLFKHLQWDLCDLPKITEHIWGKAEVQAPIALQILRLATYLCIYILICFSCYTSSFLSVCCTSCDNLYTVFFWKHSREQLDISLESEISSLPIYHSFGLRQSVKCVWFLSHHGNKLPVFIACFSQATLQQSCIVCDQLC